MVPTKMLALFIVVEKLKEQAHFSVRQNKVLRSGYEKEATAFHKKEQEISLKSSFWLSL